MSSPSSKVLTSIAQPARAAHRLRTSSLALLVLSAVLTSACAAGRNGPVNQELAIRPVQSGQRVEASCEVGNGSTQWHVVAPTRLSVTRSSNELTLHCKTVDGFTGHLSVAAHARSYPETLVVQIDEAPGEYERRTRQAPFASLTDIDKVPNVGNAGRQAYRRFLSEGKPRAFAVSDRGDWVRVNQMQDPERAALSRCQSYGGHCQVYAVDDSVVWKVRSPAIASN